MHIARARNAQTTYEYGCDLRRLYPWAGVADPLWGSAIASVRPGEATTPHAHDEEETFIILAGTGTITIDGTADRVETGDVIYLPRGSSHTIANASTSERLDFLTIFWGSPEARARMAEEVAALRLSGDGSPEAAPRAD
jgi:mannose-6-phosphate isomerase-like protein (cupin superfamily)